METTKRYASTKPRKNLLSLNNEKTRTNNLHDEFNAQKTALARVKKEKAYIQTQIRMELQQQKDLRIKIEYLKKEMKLINMSLAANKNILTGTKNKSAGLTSEVNHLTQKIHELRGTKKRTLVHNDFAKLIEVVNLEGGEYQKEKSVLLTCSRDIINTTEQNEFTGYVWRAKFATADGGIGLRIRFDNLNIGQNDLSSVYKPVIAGLAAKFKRYDLRIQTRTKNINGIITAMDFTLKMPTNEVVIDLGGVGAR